MLYWNAPSFRRLVYSVPTSADAIAYISGTVAVGFGVAAYILSLTSTFLREILEGRHFPNLFPSFFFENQRQKRSLLYNDHRTAKVSRHHFQNMREVWISRLTAAKATVLNYSEPSETHQLISGVTEKVASGEDCTVQEMENAVSALTNQLEKRKGTAMIGTDLLEADYQRLLSTITTSSISTLFSTDTRTSWKSRLTSAKAKEFKYVAADEAHRLISALVDKVGRGEDCTIKEMEDAIFALANHLEKVTATIGADLLEEDHQELVSAIDDAIDHFSAKEVASFNKKVFLFGDADVAPTAIGNIALSVEDYAYTRYNLNLTHFWSRFQPVLQKQKDFYVGLVEAKTQLEFLVACFWLATISMIGWMAFLAFKSYDMLPFLVVATLGPFFIVTLYRMAVTNYIVFADLVRTSVDLYRLELLSALHISPPSGIREERSKWRTLELVSAIGQREQ